MIAKKAILGAMVLGLMTTGSVWWKEWDNFYERDEYFEPGSQCNAGFGQAYWPKGWMFADGGMSVRHPASNRTFFFYGDSFGWYGPGTGGKAPNTMGMAYGANAWIAPQGVVDNGDTQFFARNTSGTKIQVGWDMSQAVGTTAAWYQGSSASHWYWPADALMAPGSDPDQLLLFWTRMKCGDSNKSWDDEGGCGGPDPNFPDVDLEGRQKVCLQNVTGSPLNWATPACVWLTYELSGTKYPLQHNGLHWGNSLWKDADGYVYIFGTTFDGAWPDGDVADAVLARALPADVQNYANWSFWNSAGQWKPFSHASLNPPTPQNLGKVATGANPYFTVDTVTVNNHTRYVMTQSTPDGSNQLLMRIGKRVNGVPLKEWYNLPNPLVSDTNTFVKQIAGSTGFDPPCDNSRLVVHALGHMALSPAGNERMVSYYCQMVHHNDDKWPDGTWNHNVTPRENDNPPNNNGTCTETPTETIESDFFLGFNVNVYDRMRIRYHLIDMAKLRPWCTAGLPTCWMP